MKNLVSAVSLIAAFAGTPVAHGDHVARSGGIHVEHAWARATAGRARNGAAYFTIVNTGRRMDRLVAASAGVADRAELHAHSMKKGVMRMHRITGMEVHPGEPTVLRPGGTHVMLMGLHHRLRTDERIPMTLTFERAGNIDVMVVVQGPGSMRPESHQGHGRGMNGHGGHDMHGHGGMNHSTH